MENVLKVHTDGGARGNPGPAAIGVVIECNGKTISEFGKRIGESTNNVAEYTAVIEALKYLIAQGVTRVGGHPRRGPLGGFLGGKRAAGSRNKLENTYIIIHFFLDSKLVVEQLNGRFKVKDSKLRELLFQVKILEQEVGGEVIYKIIHREQNCRADFLVNQALDQH